jgi:hypothetical protein
MVTWQKLTVLAGFFGVPLIGCSAASESSPSYDPSTDTVCSAATWDCYSPEPGHPTVAEKTAWINKVSAYAQEAETSYGVPAAGLLSMTANEGGFGWTRIALYANNSFGYKWTSSTAAGGRSYYVLSCQPSSDPNNRYVAFSDARDGILFVASRLAQSSSSWANYKAATDKYKLERQQGVDPVIAVNHWIDGIADAGYNYDPASYKVKLKKTANNYLSPSTTYSGPNNLYKYSAAIAGGSPSAWISVDSPAANAVVSGDVALAASVGGGTVTNVKFYSRATGSTDSWYLIATDSTSPFATDWSTNPWVPNGNYDLRFEAYNGTAKLATETIAVKVAN